MTRIASPATADRAYTSLLHRCAFAVVVGCALIGCIGHVPAVVDVIGDGAGSFVRRQSEGYAIIAVIVVLWAWFAPDGHPSAPAVTTERRVPASRWAWIAWFVVLLGIAVVLAMWDEAPGPLATLKEAVAALIVLSAYIGWSRSLRPSDTTWAAGAPTKPVGIRTLYYVAIGVVAALTYGRVIDAIFGPDVSLWFEENSEAFGATVLVAAYFDGPARRPSTPIRAAWYGFLVAAPLLAQFGGYPAPVDSFVGWIQEMTEAFIAAIIVSVFFDFLVPPRRYRSSAVADPSGEVEAPVDATA